jgi:hypothetical protein
VAGVVMLAVSMSWIALYTLTPAADRPYADGSTNNSAVAMVFGYKGPGQRRRRHLRHRGGRWRYGDALRLRDELVTASVR